MLLITLQGAHPAPAPAPALPPRSPVGLTCALPSADLVEGGSCGARDMHLNTCLEVVRGNTQKLTWRPCNILGLLSGLWFWDHIHWSHIAWYLWVNVTNTYCIHVHTCRKHRDLLSLFFKAGVHGKCGSLLDPFFKAGALQEYIVQPTQHYIEMVRQVRHK